MPRSSRCRAAGRGPSGPEVVGETPRRLASDVVEDALERPRHPAQVQRLDQERSIDDLPAARAAHESPELRREGPPLPLPLLLQRAEGGELALGADELFHDLGPEGPDQLVLQIFDADIEAKSLHA